MSEIPNDLKYTKSHEWLKNNGDDTVTVGITDHAQELLGDLVFVELPEMGAELTADEACAVVESVKAASDVYAPLNGTVVGVNESLEDSPELVNSSPFEDGWLYRIKMSSPSELDKLLSADDYASVAEE